MPRRCSICDHADRQAIDTGLVENGHSFRAIARQYGVSRAALVRHKESHISARLAKAKQAEEASHADSLLEQVRSLQARALGLLDKAEGSGDYRTALAGVREARGCLELLGKLAGQLSDGPTVNVLVAPEWVSLRAVILRVLEPYPETRLELVTALEKVEHDSAGD